MKTIILITLLISSFYAYSQDVSIGGKATNEKVNRVTYAMAYVKKLNQGGSIDSFRNYKLCSSEIIKKKVPISCHNKKDNELIVERKNDTLDEVVVTASRSRESLSEIPSSVAILQLKKIKAMSLTNHSLSDILSNIPGVSPTIGRMDNRGQTLRGRTMLILIDGIPQSTPLFNGNRDINAISYSSIERVEIIKGATAIYGNGAGGGIVNYITKKANKYKKTSSYTRLNIVGSLVAPQNTLGNEIAQTFSKKINNFGYLVCGSFKRTGIFKDAKGEVISPFYGLGETNQYSLLGKVDYDFNDNISANLMCNYYSSRQHSSYVHKDGDYTKDIPTIGVPGVIENNDDGGTRYNYNILATLDYRNIFANTDFIASTYVKGFKTLYGFSTYFVNPKLNLEGGQSYIKSSKKGGRLNFITNIGMGKFNNKLYYGLDILNDKTEQKLLDGRVWVPPINMTNIAPYLQIKSLYRDWVLKAGIRFENINMHIDDYTTLAIYAKNKKINKLEKQGGIDIKGGKLNYNTTVFNAGLKYNLCKYIKPFLSFSQSFSVAEIGRVLKNATENSLVNMQTKAVIANNYEIGISSKIEYFSFSIAAYLSTSDLGSSYVQKSLRTGESKDTKLFEVKRSPEKIYGLEFSANSNFKEGLNAGASLAFVEGKVKKIDTNGSKSETYILGNRIPPLTVNSWLSYNYADKIYITLTHRYTGNRKHFNPKPDKTYKYGEGPVTSIHLLDLSIKYNVNKFIDLGLGITNILNNNYYPVSSQWDTRNRYYIKGNGAQFNLSMEVSL